ncbi:hypothetical protein ACFWJ4_15385 [Kitasatospora sp. NPDC127067]|uniref:hypothetical protein n=1 Tax=Kitasatospora sp. NPDC127067 TaxID=3347126 RepID=UPI00365FE069
MSRPHHPHGPAGDVVTVITYCAAQRAKELGAGEVPETLRAELEYQPRLGRLVRTGAEGGQRIELYSTRIEGNPAVNVVHAFAPAPPWPPTVRIAAVVPEDLPAPHREPVGVMRAATEATSRGYCWSCIGRCR